MIQCVKTGCVVWLEEYNEWAYGDAFEGDDFFIFRLCQRRFDHFPGQTRQHFTVHRIAHWFDDHRTSQEINSTLVAYAQHVENFGYEGVQIVTETSQ